MPLLRKFFNVPSAYNLIKFTDNLEFKTILDVGFGFGGASIHFAQKGKEVTSIGLHLEKTDYPRNIFQDLNIQTVESDFIKYNSEKKFDAILMCHVLEHTQNPGLFLHKAKDLLKDDGWLFVMVPPFKHELSRGHVSTGWNLGLLMYNLLLSGFNIKQGHFIKHDYNICAFVQKTNNDMSGVLENSKISLQDLSHLWPIDVCHGFNGNLNQVNWFSDTIKEDSFEDYIFLFDDNKITNCIKKYKNKNIALYGADYLAKAFINNYDLSNLYISAIFDKDKNKHNNFY